MYRAIVRRLIRRAFDDLGRNRLEEHRTRFAEGAVLRVHAGGETRTYVGHQQLKEGFETLRASTMQGPFELLDIWVNGWPWDTRVAVAWKRSRQVGGKRGIVYGMNRIRIQPARRGVTEEDVFIGDAPQCDASLHVFSQSAAAKGAQLSAAAYLTECIKERSKVRDDTKHYDLPWNLNVLSQELEIVHPEIIIALGRKTELFLYQHKFALRYEIVASYHFGINHNWAYRWSNRKQAEQAFQDEFAKAVQCYRTWKAKGWC